MVLKVAPLKDEPRFKGDDLVHGVVLKNGKRKIAELHIFPDCDTIIIPVESILSAVSTKHLIDLSIKDLEDEGQSLTHIGLSPGISVQSSSFPIFEEYGLFLPLHILVQLSQKQMSQSKGNFVFEYKLYSQRPSPETALMHVWIDLYKKIRSLPAPTIGITTYTKSFPRKSLTHALSFSKSPETEEILRLLEENFKPL